MQSVDELNMKLQNDYKEELDKVRNDNYEFLRSKLPLMGMIVKFFSENEEYITNDMAEEILCQNNPLEYLCEIFENYVNFTNICLDVFEDFILDDCQNKEELKEIYYYSGYEDEEDEEDDFDEFDDEENSTRFIHDDEDL